MNIRFSDGNIEDRFTENIFFHFFLFSNFVFSVQYAVFTCLIHLFLLATAQRHSARSLFCTEKFNVKTKFSAFVHQKAREI